MDVLFTIHPNDPPGKHYMAVAEAGEWRELLDELQSLGTFGSRVRELIDGLEGWGI